jgi:hypothetical protein
VLNLLFFLGLFSEALAEKLAEVREISESLQKYLQMIAKLAVVLSSLVEISGLAISGLAKVKNLQISAKKTFKKVSVLAISRPRKNLRVPAPLRVNSGQN